MFKQIFVNRKQVQEEETTGKVYKLIQYCDKLKADKERRFRKS